MDLYFAWVQEEEAFDAKEHARMDEDIFSFHLHHSEGDFPILEITVPSVHTYVEGRRKAFVSCRYLDTVHHLFTGYLEEGFCKKREEEQTLVLWGKRPDFQKQVDAAIADFKKKPAWDPLLVPKEYQNDLAEVLDQFSMLPHWDRCTGALTFSDVLQGRHRLCLGDRFFTDSFTFQHKKPAYTHVELEASVQWIQRHDGIIDVSGVFKQLGERGFISTLTPSFLEQHWWRRGSSLRYSGYTIVKSELSIIRMGQIAGMDLFPEKSSSFMTSAGQRTLPRVWFEPKLMLAWRYRQKRREILSFSLKLDTAYQGAEKTLRLSLGNICLEEHVPDWRAYVWYANKEKVIRQGQIYVCKEVHESGQDFQEEYWHFVEEVPCALRDPAAASFFLQGEGHKTIEALIEKAKVHILGSLRTREVVLEMPFEEALHLSCDHDVEIVHPFRPQKTIIGKVKNYGFLYSVEQNRYHAYVTLGVVPEVLQERVWVVGQGLQERTTFSGVSYGVPACQGPTEGIIEPTTMGVEDLVDHIWIDNNVQKQNALLEGKTFQDIGDAIKTLQQYPSRVRLLFKSLRSREVVQHTIQL